MQPHPFDPLSPEEISLVFIISKIMTNLNLRTTQASKIIRDQYPKNKLIFRVITLREPLKEALIPYLAAENASKTLPQPPARCAQVQFYLDSITSFWDSQVNLQSKQIVSKEHLEGRHSYTDALEMQESEIECLKDERVKKELAALELPNDAVVCVEPWTYAPDGMEDMTVRRIMVWILIFFLHKRKRNRLT